MTEQVIGRPVRLSAREIWAGGTRELISWFADHPVALGDVLDLSLTTLAQPTKDVARAADLIGEDVDGRLVVIEVSLSRSNNSGLGRLMSHVSALGAETAVWVADDFAAEHIGAFAWLNRSGVARFYLVQIQAFRAPSGAVSHVLTRVLGPSRLVQAAEQERRSIVERSELRRAFFDQLNSREGGTASATRGESSVIHRLTRLAGVTYNFVVEDYQSGAEVRIAGSGERQEYASAIFERLVAQRDEIEAALAPDALLWESLGPGHFRIALMIPGGFASAETDWDEIQLQLVEAMGRLRRAFKHVLRSLAKSQSQTRAPTALQRQSRQSN